MSLTIGSLFSGIGGLELGLQRGLAAAGVPTRTLWQVEQNDYARAVLARHWPHAERYTDVRDITAETVQPIDLLAGGFPCQDLSYAGKGAGLAGDRSGLFFEMARIIRELRPRPRIVVMENVPAINTRGLGTVLGTLASCGYAAKWGMLRADDPLVGAPHRRERWFCVAWLADSEDRRQRRDARELEAQSRAGEKYAGITRGAGDALGRSCKLADSPVMYSDASGDNSAKSSRPVSKFGGRHSETDMADTDSQQPPQRKDERSDRREEQPTTTRACGAHATRTIKPGMGGGPHGIPRGLDAHRWPAPPGPQHPHEPPRTRPREKHDRDRLKALGNAVVPQCAEIIGRWIGCELVERL